MSGQKVFISYEHYGLCSAGVPKLGAKAFSRLGRKRNGVCALQRPLGRAYRHFDILGSNKLALRLQQATR